MTVELWGLAIAIVLVIMAGVLAAVDSALSGFSLVRAEELQTDGRKGAARLCALLSDPAQYLNTLLLVRRVFEITATVLTTWWAFATFGQTWLQLLVAAGGMVVVTYVAIGVGPRTYGRQRADSVALRSAAPVIVLTRILGPLPKLLILIGNALTPGKGFAEGPFATEAELRAMVDFAEQSSVIESSERQMIHSVFELGDTIVREVMVPRPDMVVIERHKKLRQLLSLALRSGYSRIPVIGDSLDDVLGVVYLKDVMRRVYDNAAADSTETVESVMRRAAFVPDSKQVDALLREMQAARTHVGIVIDEYGGTAGLVTIEDILEEIVGEIVDEYDTAAPDMVEPLADGVYRVSTRLPVDDLGELFGLTLTDDDVDTVGGLMAKELGKVPIPGAEVTVGGLLLTAERPVGRRNRVGTMLAREAAPEPDETEVSDTAPAMQE